MRVLRWCRRLQSERCLSLQKQTGFTLLELLIAAAVVLGVITASGIGLRFILNANQNNRAQTERRLELSRALDFIAAEVRQSSLIATDAAAVTSTEAQTMLSTGAPKQPVLTLDLPGTNVPVIYFIAAAPSPWRGPNAIFRWGPAYAIDGTYTNLNTPAAWQAQPLIDLITDESITPNCPTPDWTLNPATNVTGFYTCVNAAGKLAQVYHRGVIERPLGTSGVTELNTQVFARNLTIGANGPNFGLPTPGVPFVTGPSRITVETIGGIVTCGAGGPVIPTSGTVDLSNGVSRALPPPGGRFQEDVPAGTTLRVTAQTDGSVCGISLSANSNTDHGRQVVVLRNGDQVPSFQPFDRQPAIAAFLDPYIEMDGTTRRVRIEDNQAIFLFELGIVFDSTKAMNAQDSAFDLQDLVVLATIEAR